MSETVNIRERRLLLMTCVCGDSYERDLYGSDITSDIAFVQDKIDAFKKRHETCAKEPA